MGRPDAGPVSSSSRLVDRFAFLPMTLGLGSFVVSVACGILTLRWDHPPDRSLTCPSLQTRILDAIPVIVMLGAIAALVLSLSALVVRTTRRRAAYLGVGFGVLGFLSIFFTSGYACS
jgi:hypothetical protein